MTWQPIDSAPKDGRTIIGWSKYDSEPVTVKWSERRKTWESSWEGERVLSSQTDFGEDFKEPSPLSHWQPMPTPPLIKEDDLSGPDGVADGAPWWADGDKE